MPELTIQQLNAQCPDALTLLGELNEALERLTGASGEKSFQPEDVMDSRACFAIAYADGVPMGCGAFRRMTDTVAELKRVYARPNQMGVARQLVAFLEQRAAQYGYREMRLETRRVNRHAVDFYLRCGYNITDNYGKYASREDAVCFQKVLKE